jgi:hypothetical protein
MVWSIRALMLAGQDPNRQVHAPHPPPRRRDVSRRANARLGGKRSRAKIHTVRRRARMICTTGGPEHPRLGPLRFPALARLRPAREHLARHRREHGFADQKTRGWRPTPPAARSRFSPKRRAHEFAV